MAVWAITGALEGGATRTFMVDSVTEWAFGPAFADENEALDFQIWCVRMFAGDPMKMTDQVLDECARKFRETKE